MGREERFHFVKNVVMSLVKGKEEKHIKILAAIDISKPLLRGTMVKVEGDLKWANFTYERLSGFSYQCGITDSKEGATNPTLIAAKAIRTTLINATSAG
ncbi:hypothetical protein ACH5RR_021103 [Cinchona calisaya]|uniref:Uncharacterized protein n=1 Tax=Cinchona calisaya TaxID=153742 RepID=A0ABD2ZHD1_9GENT